MGLVSSLSSVLGISETATPVTAAISEMDPKTGMEKIKSDDNGGLLGALASKVGAGALFQKKTSPFQAFQYFPETISDTKSPEWVRKHVPGGSHPIVTFLNGGERILSFSAVFTQDKNPEPLGLLQAALTGSFDLSLETIFGETPRKDTCDIASAIAYLRKFTYPDYAQGVATPPPFAIVYLPNSGIIGQAQLALDSICGAMIQCDVVYEKFHRDGSARIAVVNLSFVEVVQVGENWRFVGRSDLADVLLAQGRKPYSRSVVAATPKNDAGALFGNLF